MPAVRRRQRSKGIRWPWSSQGLRKGAHVSVTYHPLGPTGQGADEVQVIERHADARSQSSFKIVTGPAASGSARGKGARGR